MARLLHWFRRDLRLTDNTALAAALSRAEEVVPVFVLDPAILTRPDTGAPRVAFLCAALAAVDARCRERGSRLVVAHGQPEAELARLCAATGADGVVFNYDDEPFARERDTRVTEALRREGYTCEGFFDQGLHGSEEIKTKDGRPYTQYAPYRKRSEPDLYENPPPIRDSAQRLDRLAPAASLPEGEPLPTAESLGYGPPSPNWPTGGEDEGRARLQRFRLHALGGYTTARDFPAQEGTSHLSPFLRFGVVTGRQCLYTALHAHKDAETRAGAETWVSELIWQDFYRQTLYHFPHVESGPTKPQFANLSWENDEGLWAAWQRGETGYPLVDAAMRQIDTLAWMHNRCRLIVSGFLIKDLLVNWQWGERYFMTHLADGDLAANNGGWQWSASTGTDAQPFFRILNPTTQSERFDPNGDFIRRWLPELANVPTKYIHAPHTLPPVEAQRIGFRVGVDYPTPVVDHAERRNRALAMYRKAVGKA